MELKIVDPDALLLFENFGITNVRVEEILYFLDSLIDVNLGRGPVRLHVPMNQIAKFCNTLEELVFALDLHSRFLERNGCVLAPTFESVIGL